MVPILILLFASIPGLALRHLCLRPAVGSPYSSKYVERALRSRSFRSNSLSFYLSAFACGDRPIIFASTLQTGSKNCLRHKRTTKQERGEDEGSSAFDLHQQSCDHNEVQRNPVDVVDGRPRTFWNHRALQSPNHREVDPNRQLEKEEGNEAEGVVALCQHWQCMCCECQHQEALSNSCHWQELRRQAEDSATQHAGHHEVEKIVP